ncbi:hypothetical protein D3C79_821480 [compost metagenome]
MRRDFLLVLGHVLVAGVGADAVAGAGLALVVEPVAALKEVADLHYVDPIQALAELNVAHAFLEQVL